MLKNLFANNKRLVSLELGCELSFKCLLKLPLEQMTTLKTGVRGESLIEVLKITKSLTNFYYDFKDASDIVILESMSTYLSNLTTLNLEARLNFQVAKLDKMFSRVFETNRQLKSLTLKNFKSMTGKCFCELNVSAVEEITLIHIGGIPGDYLIQSWPNFEKFHTIRFFEYEGYNFTHIAECFGLCSKLKTLHINGIKNGSSNDLIKSLSSSNELEKLCVQKELFSNELCHYISCNLLELKSLTFYFCEFSLSSIQSVSKLHGLEKLDLTGCYGISDSSLEVISKLPKLQVLRVEGLRKITGSGFGGFPNLEKLNCSFCENVENNGLVNLLRCANKLKVLDFRYCPKITNSVIDVAIEVTENRKDYVILEVYIAGTSIDIDKIVKKSPLLYLNLNLYSKE